jgi:gluconolactonase
MRSVLLVTFLMLPACAGKEILFTASDFTLDNLFTSDIEGPCYMEGTVYVVNLEKNGTIGEVNDEGKASLFLVLPDGSTANAIQFNTQGEMLLADFTGHNILKVNMATKSVSVLVHNSLFNQPNDICINGRDQVFASDPNWKEGTGQIWRIDPDGNSHLLLDDMGTTNGIELSPDEKTLYVNESVQRRIWAFDVDPAGEIGHQRLFFEFTDFGMDGMKCDNQGNLYVTRYGKGTIAILSPQGTLIREVALKGRNVSNIAFAGSDGKMCVVTLQDRKGMEKFRSEFAGKKWNIIP